MAEREQYEADLLEAEIDVDRSLPFGRRLSVEALALMDEWNRKMDAYDRRAQ